MRCEYCYGEVKLNDDSKYVCSSCGSQINIGVRYKLISHNKLVGGLRSPVHSRLQGASECFVNKEKIKVGEGFPFYVRYKDLPDDGLHLIYTTVVKNYDYCGGLLTIRTHNTVYEFKKVSD